MAPPWSTRILSLISCTLLLFFSSDACRIPFLMQGEWYSREAGTNTQTVFDSNSMSTRGICLDVLNTNNDNFTFVFHQHQCYYCVRLLVRTINVMERIETNCLNDIGPNRDTSVTNVCSRLDSEQQLITMFSETPTPKNCRSSLEGVWHFAYQRTDMFTGECSNPDANITSCQVPGTQFNIANQQFIINYKKCNGMEKTINADVYYSCLGDWFIDKNHYFAAVNSKESRKEEKYRCFLKNRDDDLYLGVSITADCNVLKSPYDSPERLHLTPVKMEVVTPGCSFPQKFGGTWMNTANLDAEVIINSTHIIETWHPDDRRFRRHIYVCQQQRGSRYMLARLGVDGCQKDYICYEFLPRHHNIIRFRKGTAMWINDFHTVCSWVSLTSKADWNYNLLILHDPVPIKCPIAGKFRFTQQGEMKFETRIRGGITQSPRPNVYCTDNISDFSVCDNDQRQIAIDAEYCLSVDYLGRPLDIYSEPDYIMKCVGFWKENLRSYLITMDEQDAFSRFRCWVYQRADLNRVLMSYSLGDLCKVNQQVTSFNSSEGSVVSLSLTEYERERDDCPMYFDDGGDPYRSEPEKIHIFHFNTATPFHSSVPLLIFSTCVLMLWQNELSS